MGDEQDDDDELYDTEEPDSHDYCHCRFCTCMNRTEYGQTCSDCMGGAHQG